VLGRPVFLFLDALVECVHNVSGVAVVLFKAHHDLPRAMSTAGDNVYASLTQLPSKNPLRRPNKIVGAGSSRAAHSHERFVPDLGERRRRIADVENMERPLLSKSNWLRYFFCFTTKSIRCYMAGDDRNGLWHEPPA
jgi:hypothetical protein